jgi:L-amino acid N-acyltransferase YncA
MIITATREDGPQIHAVNADTSIFSREEVECVDELWEEYQTQGSDKSGYYFVVEKEDGRVLGCLLWSACSYRPDF